MSNSLAPDQARHFIGFDMGSNCLQRLSADDTKWIKLNILLSFFQHQLSTVSFAESTIVQGFHIYIPTLDKTTYVLTTHGRFDDVMVSVMPNGIFDGKRDVLGRFRLFVVLSPY